MARILLLLSHGENRRLLFEWLVSHYEVVKATTSDDLKRPFDLGIIDGPILYRHRERIQRRKAAEEPAMLPFLLVTPRHGATIATQELWQSVDELLITPVEKAVLDARVALLLQARNFSVKLQRRNDDLQAMVHALNHDLRAPARISASFAQALLEDYGERLDEQGHHYIQRIQAANERSRQLLDRLLEFALLGRQAVNVQDVDLDLVLTVVLKNLQETIKDQATRIELQSPLPRVRADFGLLELALTNLISNALKYAPPGERPQVTVRAQGSAGRWRLEVVDRGIGIPFEDQERVFQAFVRLHGEETYEGSGLGLSIARKAVELMGGRIGVESEPGVGSTFWIELERAH